MKRTKWLALSAAFLALVGIYSPRLIAQATKILEGKVSGASGSQAVVTNSSGNIATSATLSPALGGTGVANNAAETLTFVGDDAVTFTTTAASAVTLPTSGTLAILGANTFTATQTISGTATTPLSVTTTNAGGYIRTESTATGGVNEIGLLTYNETAFKGGFVYSEPDDGLRIYGPASGSVAAGKINSSSAWTIGAAGGTQNHAVIGSLTVDSAGFFKVGTGGGGGSACDTACLTEPAAFNSSSGSCAKAWTSGGVASACATVLVSGHCLCNGFL